MRRARQGLAVAGLVAGGCFSERPPTDASGEDFTVQTAVGTCRVAAGSEVAGGARVVAIKDFKFAPDTVRVPVGTTVAWVNCEDAAMVEPHTSTSDTRVWSSPSLLPAAAYSRRFDQRGAFPYHCEPHPAMRATVIVE